MISPDAGNMGVKAVYVWAGLLIPTTILLWLYYPEVRRLFFPSTTLTDISRPTAEPTWSLTSFMSGRSPLGSSKIPQLCPTRVDKKTRPSFPAKRNKIPLTSELLFPLLELPFPLELPLPAISSNYGQKDRERPWNLAAAKMTTTW